jgi:hypothetical protein
LRTLNLSLMMLAFAASTGAACSGDTTTSDSGAVTDSGTTADADTDTDSDSDTDSDADADSDTDTDVEPPEPDVAEFGFEEGRVLEKVMGRAEDLSVARDLAFHPDRDELWVLSSDTGGRYGGAGFTIVHKPGSAAQSWESRTDVYAYHFMDDSSAFAFGAAEFGGSSEVNFATAQESNNDYHSFAPPPDDGDDFMGPTLWSSDLLYYAYVYQDGNTDKGGSHLDMLHQSPRAMGIAWESGNAYWVFDGDAGNLVRYDFASDHGAGGEDHGDGVIRRYSDASVTRVEEVPGHMELDHDTNWLYIADTGGGRVIRLDITSGSKVRDLSAYGERPDEYSLYTGATVEDFVTGLSLPSGLTISDGRLFVGENGTGTIHAYDLATGTELDSMKTGAAGLTGIAVSGDAELWYLDTDNDGLYRVHPGAGE